MGRHVNHQDEQDRWINKATKINRSNRLDEREPGSLSLAEQIELVKIKRKEEKVKAEAERLRKEQDDNRHRFSHYVPKTK